MTWPASDRCFRFLPAVLAVLVLGCGGGGELPVPADLGELDPMVRGHLERLLEAARREGSTESLVELGLGYYANERGAEALAVLDLVAARLPGEPLPAYYAALAAQGMGGGDEGAARLREIVRRWPDFAPARERLGWALLDSGELAAAATAFEGVVERAADHPGGYFGLAEAQLQAGEVDAALATLEGAPRTPASRASADLLRGRALRAVGRLEEAAPLLLRQGADAGRGYLADGWTNRVAAHVRGMAQLVDRARALTAVGRPDAAVRLLEEIRAAHPGNFEVESNLAVAYIRSGRGAEARALLEAAVADHPDRFEGHLNLAAALLEQSELAPARAAAERAVALAPGVAQAHRTLSKVLDRMGAFEEALGAIAEADRLEPGNPVLAVELGRAAIRAGRPELAEAACRRVVELSPEALAGPLCLGEALRRQDRRAEALEALAAARELDAGHPDVAKLAARLGEG